MTLTSNWIALPEILYLLIAVGSIFLYLLSLLSLIFGLKKKKDRAYILIWLISLIASLFLIYLTLVAKVIVADTMIGG